MSCNGIEDLFGGFGPQERAWVFVPVCDPGADVALQRLDTFVDTAADLLVGE